jgi:hypothetical protein
VEEALAPMEELPATSLRDLGVVAQAGQIRVEPVRAAR